MKNTTYKYLGIILLFFVFVALILVPIHKKPPVKKKLPVVVGRIAIVIDDWGYSLNNLPIVQQIKQPLTCAILPGLKNSKLAMQELNNLGFEIILHLPMEPKEKYNLENNTITIAMDAVKIHNVFEKDLANIILARGVSNHMGSRVTEDKKTSTLVMAEAKKRNLYFFDSFVTNKSVCPILSKKIGVKFAKRDVFLDNSNDPEYIKGQLRKLKKIARNQGVAIGIGHDRKNTLLVLKEMLPQLEAEGYQFVFLSQVVR
ncbi:MAG: divergent polysaccharide deacetylase family protein [Candidatus Omnitrophica bacterium]|nr:divergent polysaccharide deacetylase family protein [Candidatus Omnitrophota bacterium]